MGVGARIWGACGRNALSCAPALPFWGASGKQVGACGVHEGPFLPKIGPRRPRRASTGDLKPCTRGCFCHAPCKSVHPRSLEACFGSAVLAPCGQAMSELQNMASYLRFCK